MPILQSLNTRSVALLAETARIPRAPSDCPAVHGSGELWVQVEERACERAGRCPVLLINLNFESPEWWRRVSEDSAQASRSHGQPSLFNEEKAASLIREILMETWRLGRSLPRAANLLFGMAPAVSAAIFNFSSHEIDRIAISHARSLRPRWEENRIFWTNLLETAIGTDDESLAMVHLHCMQLLCDPPSVSA